LKRTNSGASGSRGWAARGGPGGGIGEPGAYTFAGRGTWPSRPRPRLRPGWLSAQRLRPRRRARRHPWWSATGAGRGRRRAAVRSTEGTGAGRRHGSRPGILPAHAGSSCEILRDFPTEANEYTWGRKSAVVIRTAWPEPPNSEIVVWFRFAAKPGSTPSPTTAPGGGGGLPATGTATAPLASLFR